MKIRLNDYGLWSIVNVGTFGWVKCMDNTIRQCKCVNVYFDNHGVENMPCEVVYEWLVGGKGILKGTSSRIEKFGIIYETKESAMTGLGNPTWGYQQGEMSFNKTINILSILKQKYGLNNACLERDTFTTNYTLRTYGIFNDNTINLLSTNFHVTWSEKGVIDVIVPMLEGGVKGIRRYPTREIALQHIHPLKVYTLDDEIENGTASITKVKLIIEVETTNLENIKKIAKILN